MNQFYNYTAHSERAIAQNTFLLVHAKIVPDNKNVTI